MEIGAIITPPLDVEATIPIATTMVLPAEEEEGLGADVEEDGSEEGEITLEGGGGPPVEGWGTSVVEITTTICQMARGRVG